MKKIAVVYGEMEKPIQKKALELISCVILEQTMEYPVCVNYSELKDKDAFRCIYIGTRDTNPYIAENCGKSLTEEEEYCIRVVNDSVIIEGYDEAGVLYGCIDFYNKYIVEFENRDTRGAYFKNILQEETLPEFELCSAPSVKNRGIWTWGHVIYNYPGFIDNMLKLKLNTLIIWNDFVPVNAKEMIEYAHNCNIKVIWGYSWLWDVKCDEVDMDAIYSNVDAILDKYEKEYLSLGVDGIYFQSFTELCQEKIGEVLVADAVTKFVNTTAEKFFNRFGEMELQFGLHATSVNERLEYIRNVDSRIRLYWEDCGSFPFDYDPKRIENYDKTKDFVIKTTHLRNDEKYGAVTKGLVYLDWNEFKHLKGAFHIGKCSKKVTRNCTGRKNRIWRYIQSQWIANADKAYDMVKTMCDETDGDLYITALVEDGMFEENVMYPVALYSEMLWDVNGELKNVMSQVALRSYVEFA